MSLENEGGPLNVEVKDQASAIRVVLKNVDISHRKLHLEYPGKLKYWKIKLQKSSGALIAAFGLLDTIKETMHLEIRIKYGKPPANDNYDFQLGTILHPDHQENTAKYATLNSSSVHCRTIDIHSFICQSPNSTVGDLVWFSARYDGPMPPRNKSGKHITLWNFTSSVHEPTCLFWNKATDSFDGTGVEVCCLN